MHPNDFSFVEEINIEDQQDSDRLKLRNADPLLRAAHERSESDGRLVRDDEEVTEDEPDS